jgi:hypothetical protein
MGGEEKLVLGKDLFTRKLGVLFQPFLETYQRIVLFVVIQKHITHLSI